MLICLIAVSTLLISSYIFVLRWSLSAWKRRDFIQFSHDYHPKVTVIIAARNEENTISDCLMSVSTSCKMYDSDNQLYEIILVDDQSTDETVKRANGAYIANLKVITASKTGKKSAVEDAVKISDGQVLIFTDADSVVGKQWITSHINYHQKYDFVTGLVSFHENGDYLTRLQVDDMIATMLLTHAGIKDNCFYMANGANMSCKKALWCNIQSSRSDNEISSGDDVFLVQKIASIQPEKVGFLSDVDGQICTKTCVNWSDFMNQRTRWAGKTKHTQNIVLYMIQGMVFAMVSLAWLFILIGVITFSFKWLVAGLTFISMKLLIDYIYLEKGRKLLDYNIGAPEFLKASFAYQIYIIIMAVAVVMPGKILWKGREVRH